MLVAWRRVTRDSLVDSNGLTFTARHIGAASSFIGDVIGGDWSSSSSDIKVDSPLNLFIPPSQLSVISCELIVQFRDTEPDAQ